MKAGIVFIWSEKNLIEKIMKKMESMGFLYIENFAIVNLSQTKIQEKGHEIVSLEDVNAIEGLPVKDLFFQEKNKNNFFCKTKRILLLFRKFDGKQLELRHQRTADIFFDLSPIYNFHLMSPHMIEQVYQMIETLLPKASLEGCTKKTLKNGLRMVEL